MYKIAADLTKPTLLTIQSVSDDRGLLVPFTDDVDHDLFRRCYVVEDYGRGVIRGLHYHEREMKIFTIVSGAAKFVTVKLDVEMARKGDVAAIREFLLKNPGCVQTFVLSSRHHGVVAIPPYYANGWISLEDHTILVALGNLRFEEAREDDRRFDPFIVEKRYWDVIGR